MKITSSMLLNIMLLTILSASFFLVNSTASNYETTSVEYDPWRDLNDDGVINIYDVVMVTGIYGSTGTPINKTALLLDLLSRLDSLNSTVTELETTVNYLSNTIVYLNTTTPIGAIIPWAKDLTGIPSLPYGFVECNGQILNDSESPLNGQTIPNLNGEYRFLRGAPSSGATGGSDTHSHDMNGGVGNRIWATCPGGCWIQVSTTGGHPSYVNQYTQSASSLPRFYSVVWIIRVK